jgi:hypothetical protein
MSLLFVVDYKRTKFSIVFRLDTWNDLVTLEAVF